MSILAARLGIDIHEIELELSHVRASRYLSAAGYVLLLYDYLLTLPDEVRLIWPTSWSLVKVVAMSPRISSLTSLDPEPLYCSRIPYGQ
ncbi:hypothetical protein FRC09_009269 [Ceratobasidium sp. 395]|nr:hypothetical protein FRC09_009269 [Ceratobasidium sp. 395]